MSAEIISFDFMIGCFFAGMILGLITIATGKPIYKIIDVIALFGIIAGLMFFMPNPNAQTTIEQTTSQVLGIMGFLVNVIVPYFIGDAISSTGYMLITGQKN